MTRIEIAIVPEGEKKAREGFKIDVQHLPRVGDAIYLEDKLDLVGEYEVTHVRHNYNWLETEKRWTDKDIDPVVFVKPTGFFADRWSKS